MRMEIVCYAVLIVPTPIIGDLEFITQSPIINNVIAYED